MKTFCHALYILSLLALFMVSWISSVSAQGGSLNITEVSVDFDVETITIMGEDLDYGGALIVTLGDLGLLDVSTETPTIIVVNFPEGGLPNGDYLLTVSRGNSPNQNDEYDLTVGEVGPPGPPGPALEPCGLCPCNLLDVLPQTTTCWGTSASWSWVPSGNACSLSRFGGGLGVLIEDGPSGANCEIQISASHAENCPVTYTVVQNISPLQNWACRLCFAEYAYTLDEKPDITVSGERPIKCPD